MIKLEVTCIDGRPPEEPISSEFGEAGGSIGRAAGSALVLPDPDRRISRTQAMIAVRGGRYMIYDVGSATPVHVNGRMLGKGREAPIRPGDEIRIGVYTIRVEAGASAGMPSTAGARPAASASQPQDDPFGLFDSRTPSGTNPFADLLEPQPASGLPSQAPGSPGAGSTARLPDRTTGHQPDNLDPFGVPPAGPTAPERVAAPAPPAGWAIIPDDVEFDFGPGPASSQRIDEAFDLGSTSVGGDPFGSGHPLGEPVSHPNTATADDPIASLEGAPRASDSRATRRDDTPEIHAAWPVPDRPLAGSGSPPATQPEADKMFVSWDGPPEATDAIRTVIIPSRAPELSGPGAAAAPTASSTMPSTPSPPPAPTTAPAAGTHASDAALLAAFLAGAGMPNLQLPGGLTPERMESFGRLFREATQGTLDLLVARAIAKRELRAQMTMIVARENNPLKLSPTAEAALAHLLAPQEGHGFMPPLRAMRDAYDDLRAHQLAFMAGMRAALAGVLARFDPARLEGRLTQKSVIDSVLPMNRKAKLWDLFEELFADLSREAEDDFHALFGREFVRAYEAQLTRLESRGGERPKGGGNERPESRGDDRDDHGRRRQSPDEEGGA